MLPYIHILSREIPMYGIMAGVGVLLAVLYLKHAEKRYPKLEADAELAFIYGIVGAFVGAKALFWPRYSLPFWRIFRTYARRRRRFREISVCRIRFLRRAVWSGVIRLPVCPGG